MWPSWLQNKPRFNSFAVFFSLYTFFLFSDAILCKGSAGFYYCNASQDGLQIAQSLSLVPAQIPWLCVPTGFFLAPVWPHLFQLQAVPQLCQLSVVIRSLLYPDTQLNGLRNLFVIVFFTVLNLGWGILFWLFPAKVSNDPEQVFSWRHELRLTWNATCVACVDPKLGNQVTES